MPHATQARSASAAVYGALTPAASRFRYLSAWPTKIVPGSTPSADSASSAHALTLGEAS